MGGYFCLPTGAGKSYLALLLSLASEMPTLIVVPSVTLMDQFIGTLKKLDKTVSITRFDGVAKRAFGGHFIITTYASLEQDMRRHEPLIPYQSIGLIWADEAHHSLTAGRAALIQQLQSKAHVFGLTATDEYLTKRKKGDFKNVGQVFGKKIFGIELLELINNNELSPVKTVIVHAPGLPPRRSDTYKSKKDDEFYTDAELEEVLNQDMFNSIICDTYLNEYDPDTKEFFFKKPALVFCIGVAHAEAVCDLLNKQSKDRWNGKYPLAASVHYKVSHAKRAEYIRLHAEGLIPVLVGDRVFEEGYDNPAEEIGFFIRPNSLQNTVSFKQGRGRMFRKAPHKKYAIILDWCYDGLEQLITADLFNGQRWVNVPHVYSGQEGRKTRGYRISWDPAEKREVSKSVATPNPATVKIVSPAKPTQPAREMLMRDIPDLTPPPLPALQSPLRNSNQLISSAPEFLEVPDTNDPQLQAMIDYLKQPSVQDQPASDSNKLNEEFLLPMPLDDLFQDLQWP